MMYIVFFSVVFYFYIIIQGDHELAASLEAPNFLSLGETVLLNATVSSTGTNNETNVELQLLIDKTVVASQNYSSLLSGTSETLSYSWTPMFEGTYNVTAYTVPVLMSSLSDNQNTKTVNVRRTWEVFIPKGIVPFSTPSIYPL